MHHKSTLLALTLFTLLCGNARAALPPDDSEQVLLPGDELILQPQGVEVNDLNGIRTLTKTFELPPEDDPETLREEDFTQGGYRYQYEQMRRKSRMQDDNKTVSETVTVDAKTNDLAAIIQQLPGTRAYEKDGYRGTLTLDPQSIKTEATGYTTKTDNHPHSVTKTYTLPHNDRSLVPETVQADGMTLPRTSLSWSRSSNVADSDVPDTWIATAVFSKTTYTSAQIADGYRTTAVYSGVVCKTSVQNMLYTVTYTGEKLPLAPFLPPEVTVPQVVIVAGLFVLLLAAFVLWFVRYHIARVYVYNEERKIHDVVSRQYVRVKSPKLRLNVLRGHAEAEYTVILRKRLAKRLVGRDIAIDTGGEGQHHIVESFVGSDYAFSVHL